MWPLIVVYNASSVGSIAGGWLSGGLIKRGWSLNAARKTALLICGIAVLPVLYAPYSKNLWAVVALVSLATAVHQGWSANLFTLTSDLFPRAAVGTVVGIGAATGSLGGVLVQVATGYIVGPHPETKPHAYLPLFIFAGCGYLLALGTIHLLSPKLAPAKLD
jgi:ACS family hexuronate transporter-like MFS transporter